MGYPVVTHGNRTGNNKPASGNGMELSRASKGLHQYRAAATDPRFANVIADLLRQSLRYKNCCWLPMSNIMLVI